MSVNGGGGGGSTPFPQQNRFFFLKEKKMPNILKCKDMYVEGFQVILNLYLLNTYILDHSESIDMHIEK